MIINILHDSANQTIIKLDCVIVCFKFHAFPLMGSFFSSWQLHKHIANQRWKTQLSCPRNISKSFPVQRSAFSDETGWLKKLKVWSSSSDLPTSTFSNFHPQLPQHELFKTVSTLLQLLFKLINSPAMVHHCM